VTLFLRARIVEFSWIKSRAHLDIKNYDLEVHSERQIIKKRGSIRPDISIWKKNEVISIIECKTQLGWNRNKWEEDFQKRELKFKNGIF